MAAHGREPDDDIWEDASDLYEVRSEAGSSESEDQSGPDADDVDSSEVQVVAPPRDEPAERAVQIRRMRNPRSDRGVLRHGAADSRGSTSLTPQSAYHLAPLSTKPSDVGARYVPTPLPRSDRGGKPGKPRDDRSFIKPPRIGGKDNCIESHLVQFEIIAKRNQWDENEKADFLKCSLSGKASHMLRDLDETATYDDVITKRRQRYGSLEQTESFRMELKQRKRKPGESLSHLLKDIRRLFRLAYSGPPNYMFQITARDAFIDALDDRELMIKVIEREPNTLDQAFKIAECMELYQKIPKDQETEGKAKPAAKVRGASASNDNVLQSVIEMQKGMQKQLTMLTEA